MSTTSTPNLGLVKPTLGTGEHADVSVINDNMDAIDAAVGAVGDTSLQEQVSDNADAIGSLSNSLYQAYTDVQLTTNSGGNGNLGIPRSTRVTSLRAVSTSSYICLLWGRENLTDWQVHVADATSLSAVANTSVTVRVYHS